MFPVEFSADPALFKGIVSDRIDGFYAFPLRFRPANISLINRRHYLPRLLLILSSNEKDDQRTLTGQRVSPARLERPQGDRHLRREAAEVPLEPVAVVGRPDTCLDRSRVRRLAECG